MTIIEATILVDDAGRATIEAAGRATLAPGRYVATLRPAIPDAESPADDRPTSNLDGFPVHLGLRLVRNPDGSYPNFRREEMYDDDGR